MATTSPDNIYYPIGSTDVGDLKGVFALVATSTQAALVSLRSEYAIKTYKPANAAALSALTGMGAGDLALQIDTGITYRFNGTAWKSWWSAQIAHTPTIANITVGNGTLTARYRFRDGVCMCEGSFVFGSTSAISAAPRITHPVTADAMTGSDNFPLGSVTFLDAGIAAYMGFVQGVNTTAADIRTSLASGTYTTPGGLSSTVPFTFAVNDSFMWRYEFTPA